MTTPQIVLDDDAADAWAIVVLDIVARLEAEPADQPANAGKA